jgi:murein DD-endopeptidase / murein LD-carboxypeptidase
MKKSLALICLLLLCACMAGNTYARKHHHHAHMAKNRITKITLPEPSSSNLYPVTDVASPDSVVQFAQTLLGTPYHAASSNPAYGFDCSGFVSYVFKSFSINVPRSSSEYYNAGEKVDLEDTRPGDIIMFTGTKSHHPHSIGHVGIVCCNQDGEIKFIHSTSGKENGVTITTMNDLYKRRFVRVIRLLKPNDAILASK